MFKGFQSNRLTDLHYHHMRLSPEGKEASSVHGNTHTAMQMKLMYSDDLELVFLFHISCLISKAAFRLPTSFLC